MERTKAKIKMNTNISQTVKSVVAQECGWKIKDIHNNTLLMNNRGADYFDALGVLYTLQHRYDVALPEDQYDKYATVGGLTQYIVARLRHRTK